ncbi:MAG: DUF4760 domain-containing protein [Candidatus Angelobacter sp.]
MPDPKVLTEWKLLGETGGFWVQNAILAVSAFLGILTIKSSGRQERRRATIDLVIHQTKDPELIEARQHFHELLGAGESNFCKHLDDNTSQAYKSVMAILNAYEFAASGIREAAFDEYTYKRNRYSTVLKDWAALRAFVMEFRYKKKISTLFQEFEWLARRWEKRPLKADTKTGPLSFL